MEKRHIRDNALNHSLLYFGAFLVYLKEIIHFRVLCGWAGEMYFITGTNRLPCASVNVISINSLRRWGTKTDPECKAGNGHCIRNDLNYLQKSTNLLIT